MRVACLTLPGRARYCKLAAAMMHGVAACGDRPHLAGVHGRGQPADVAVCWGWKHHQAYRKYPKFVYFDLGYWGRDEYLRFSAGGWSPVVPKADSSRFDRLGLTIKPWRTGGDEIIVAGSTAKACQDHGYRYQEWERRAIQRLQGCGKRIVYRPKPNDRMARPIEGAEYDQRPISEALGSAWGLVTHHSNTAIDALLAGVPVHCETGAASALSVPMETLADPGLPEREPFLHGVAWLQWTLDEIRSGEAWAFIRSTL